MRTTRDDPGVSHGPTADDPVCDDDAPFDERGAEIAGRYGKWRLDVAAWTAHWSIGIANILGRPLPPGGALSLDEHLECFEPRDRRIARDRLLASETPSSFERRYRVLRPDGEERTVIVRGGADRDAAGRLTRLHGIAIDVTEVSRLERLERESATMLRVTLDSIDQGIVMLGPDHRVRTCNRRAKELFALPQDLIREGAPFSAILDHLAARGEYEGWTEAERRRAHPSVEGVYERRLRDGAVLEVRTATLDDGGTVRTITDVTARHRANAALAESERRFRLLAEHASDLITWCDLDATRRYVSPASKTLLGYEPDELVGTRPMAFVHPADAVPFACIIDDLRHARVEHATTRQRYRRKDGTYVWVEASIDLIRDPATGEASGLVAAVRDVSERKAAEEALRLSEERLALAIEGGSDGFWDCDLATREIRFFGGWMSLLGYEAGGMGTVEEWRDLLHPEDRERTLALFHDHFKGRTSDFQAEYRIRTASGAYLWVAGRGKIVARDASGRATRIVGTHFDISKRKEAEDLVAHMALHDALTDLPNRVLFRDRLLAAMRDAGRDGSRFAVLSCDLDRFKAVNDDLGHPAGDALLRQVADRLRAAVRSGDVVARWGGDEFAVLVHHLNDPRRAGSIASGLIAALAAPLEIEGVSITVGVSVGIAIGDMREADADAVLKKADVALYRAKTAGHNQFRFYDAGSDGAAGTWEEAGVGARRIMARSR